MRNKVWAVSVCIACLGTAVHAHETEDLTAIGEDTIRLRAMIEREKARTELNALRGVDNQVRSDVPTVAWVEGIGAERAAYIRLAPGYFAELRVGDTLPDGSRITEILPNRVTTSSRQGSRSLPFDRNTRSMFAAPSPPERMF